MAGAGREAELQRLRGAAGVLVVEGVADLGLLSGGEGGHGLEDSLAEALAGLAVAGERLPGDEVGAQARVVGEAGGGGEVGGGGGALVGEEVDAPALVVAPGEVGGAAEELLEFGEGAAELPLAPERLGEAEAGERRVGVEVEVAAEQAALDLRAELAVVAVEVVAELAVVAVEDRDLAEEGEDHALDAGGVGEPRAVLLDEDDVGALRPGVGGEDEEIAAALADHAIVGTNTTFLSGQVGGAALVGEGEEEGLGVGEVEAVPARPEGGRAGREAGAGEGDGIGGVGGAVQAVGGVAQAILDAVEVSLDLAAVGGRCVGVGGAGHAWPASTTEASARARAQPSPWPWQRAAPGTGPVGMVWVSSQ